jgi:acyl-coenzyme A thioesterase PaaI-like protein
LTSELLGRSDIRIAGRRVAIDPHNCFACGDLNAHGLQLRLHTTDQRCWTELVLPREFEGWEGIAHGGIVCTILDEVMAWALISSDSWGLTARMSVAFRRPVRVGSRIRAEGWLVDTRRRLYDTAARLVDAETGEELASAEATYAAAPEERKRALKTRYGFRTIDDDLRTTDDEFRTTDDEFGTIHDEEADATRQESPDQTHESPDQTHESPDQTHESPRRPGREKSAIAAPEDRDTTRQIAGTRVHAATPGRGTARHRRRTGTRATTTGRGTAGHRPGWDA